MKILNYPVMKLLMAILVVFTPIMSAVITMFVLTLVDMVLGIIAAKKRGEVIRISSAIRRTGAKALVYGSSIIVAFLAQTYLTGDIFPVSNIATAFVGLAETASLLENINELGGGLNPLVNKIKMMEKKDEDILRRD